MMATLKKKKVQKFVTDQLLKAIFIILMGVWAGWLPASAHETSSWNEAMTFPATRKPQAVGFPFSYGFEDSSLPSYWQTTLTGNGQVQLNEDYPHQGTRSVFIGQEVAGAASAALVLPINLTGQTDVFLDFWWRATGNAGESANGIYISDNDGATWAKIRGLNANSYSYSHELLNIVQAARDNGKTLNSKFRIRIFFQGTFFSNPGDGIVIDDLRLSQRSGLTATFPFTLEAFEAGTFRQGLYPQSSNKGGGELSTDYPHQGTQGVFLGQRLAGAATAELQIAINLANQADVFLDFWWRATGNARESANGVYISDNDGATWAKIRELDANSHSYSHELLNIVQAAKDSGKTLNDKFRIRIFFQGTFFSNPGDGLFIDDLRLTPRANQLAPFPFALNNFETEIFQPGLFPRSTGAGSAQIDDTYPHSGTKSLFLGQNLAGAATAELVIPLNLTGQENVFLNFWWRATGKAKEPANGIYISNDDGEQYTLIKQLNSNSSGYQQETINIAMFAAAQQPPLTLNHKSRIRIFFQGTFFSSPGDGLVIDDLQLKTTGQSSAAVVTGNVSSGTNPDTGEITVRGPRSGNSQATLTIQAACLVGVPQGVTLFINSKSFPMAFVTGSYYRATLNIPGDLPAGQPPFELRAHFTCGAQVIIINIGVLILIDPSGQITDATTGAPIKGAVITLYRVPGAVPDKKGQVGNCRTITTLGGNSWDSLPPATVKASEIINPLLDAINNIQQISPEINPQITGDDGRYAWDVIEGCWYVVVKAPGYKTRVSPLVGIPPAVTDLNFKLNREGGKVYLPLIRR